MHAQPVGHARILVAGAGALGSVFGCLLRGAGHAVTLLGRTPHLDAIAANGLRLEGLWGQRQVTGFDVVSDPAQLRGSFDAALITVKSYDTRAVAGAVAPLLNRRGVAISLQNGLGNVEAIESQLGGHRALAGRVIFGAQLVAPGCVRVTVYADPVLIGARQPGIHPGLDRLAGAWAQRFTAAGIPAERSDDIVAALWGKVLYNAALNPLGALLGVHYGALSDDAHACALMNGVIDEVFRVAVAEGVSLPWPSAAAYREVFYGRLVPATFDHRSSMLQDLERGRQTEVDAINGEVWKRGASHGIVTPINETLTRLVHVREAIGNQAR